MSLQDSNDTELNEFDAILEYMGDDMIGTPLQNISVYDQSNNNSNSQKNLEFQPLSESKGQPNKKCHKKYIRSLSEFIYQKKTKKNDCSKATFSKPKREYFRTKLIRGHKRCIRKSAIKLKPTTMDAVDLNNCKQVQAWNIFCEFIQEHRESSLKIAKTESGPLTDGKSRRALLYDDNEPESTKSKTFNDKYCSEYFSSIIIQKSFSLYLDFIFANKIPEHLCKFFNFRCCQQQVHNNSCDLKWIKLENEVKTDLISILVKPKSQTRESSLAKL